MQQNQQLLRELESYRRIKEEREREWETENNDLKLEVGNSLRVFLLTSNGDVSS